MSVDALRRRVGALRARAAPPLPVIQWVIALEEGEDVSDELRAQLGPYDTVCIHRYPLGFLGEDGMCSSGQVMSGWLKGSRGRLIPHLVREYGVDISKV